LARAAQYENRCSAQAGTHVQRRRNPQKEFGSRHPELLAQMDRLVAQMQTPEAKAGILAVSNATPEELGRLAVNGAKEK